MEIKKVIMVYFSPAGTTKKAVSVFAQGMGLPVETVNLTLPKKRNGFRRSFNEDELLIASLPVYGGRLPMYLDDFFNGLKGNGSPAIATVTYGNREYEDALIELKMRLEERGFSVKAAASFIGQHNFSPKVATGRPDAGDIAKITSFGKLAAQSIARGTSGKLSFKGTYPFTAVGYDPAKPGPYPTRPLILTSDECNICGLCADVCPWGAIDKNDTTAINNATCFRCFQCVNTCPIQAKKVTDVNWLAFLPVFEARLNEKRKEPELFIPV
ncbi:MAG: EFR1 family ferrodoxin [Smithella sp.]